MAGCPAAARRCANRDGPAVCDQDRERDDGAGPAGLAGPGGPASPANADSDDHAAAKPPINAAASFVNVL
jgi:hypothetical protein